MPRTRGSAVSTALLGVTISWWCAGCGGLGLPPATPVTTVGASTPTTAPSTSSSSPSPSATTSPAATPPPTSGTTAPTPDTVSRMTGGNGSATPLLVATSDLAPGWTAMPARDTRGYRMSVCGVDLEPTEPVDGAQQNWRSPSGDTFLEQHVRVYPDDTAATVLKALAAKVPGCKTYTAKDSSGGQSTFTVEKLTLKNAPEGIVAWRQRVDVPVPVPATAAATGSTTATPSPTSRTTEVIQDVAVVRSGASIVLLNAYGAEKTPDDAALVTALTALPR